MNILPSILGPKYYLVYQVTQYFSKVVSKSVRRRYLIKVRLGPGRNNRILILFWTLLIGHLMIHYFFTCTFSRRLPPTYIHTQRGILGLQRSKYILSNFSQDQIQIKQRVWYHPQFVHSSKLRVRQAEVRLYNAVQNQLDKTYQKVGYDINIIWPRRNLCVQVLFLVAARIGCKF